MARQDTHLTQTGAEVQALLDKVEGIEAGAQVNTVERLVINGNVLTPSSDKSIVILLKTFASQALNGSGDVVQGPFTIVPTSLLCAAKSLNFTAIIFNVSREMVGLWVCRSGNDNSDKFYRVLSTSNAKCYKSSNYHILDAANPGNYYALVISASNSVTFTTENISSGDRTEQTAITIADRGYVDTAVAAKYTKPASGIPASDMAAGVIPDVSNFVTKSVDDLVNYYLKSETYTKAEVQALIGAIRQFHYEIYASTSAVTNPQNNVLYLIGPTGSGEDKYEEYVYDVTKQNPWVKIGDTSIDLSNYVTISDLNTALSAYTTSADLLDLLDAKQDVIDDLDDIRDGAAAGATAYQKPSTGIPASDLADGVIPTVPTDVVKYSQQSLTDGQMTQARTNIGAGTYSKPSGGIPASDIAPGVIPAGVTVDQTYDPTSQNAQSGVAMAGALAGKQDTIDATHKLSYNLLSDTPSIPAAQVQTDWNASSGMGVLLNKPTLATVATSGSYTDLSNKPTIPTVEALTTSEIDTIWNNAS